MRISVASILVAGVLLAGPTPPSSLAGSTLPIAGGTFEASGAVFAQGGVLFVDDGQSDQLFWMTLDDAGRQIGRAEAVPLGISIADPEGITTDGSYIYVVGSQSKRDSQTGAGLARFVFDAKARQLTQAESLGELRALIYAAVPSIAQSAGKRLDGFNIEGLSWDPRNEQLLLGLRAPVVDGEALIIPLRLKDRQGRLRRDNIAVTGNSVMRLSLGGSGIRSLEYDRTAQRFWVISGADGSAEKTFGLWTWDGDSAPQAAVADLAFFDRKLKPEGITRVGEGSQGFTLLVYDTSRYLAMR